jgi:hypothetical protein
MKNTREKRKELHIAYTPAISDPSDNFDYDNPKEDNGVVGTDRGRRMYCRWFSAI